jgi:hypothetical protein
MDVNQQLAIQAQQAGTTPQYLQQTNNPTYTSAISNMIKAIMQGNNQYRQQHGLNGGVGNGGFTSSTVGQPMNITPSLPQDPTNALGTGVSQPIGFTPTGAPPALPAPSTGFRTAPLNSGANGGAFFSPSPAPSTASGDGSFSPSPASPAVGSPVGGIQMPQFGGGGFSGAVDPVTQALMSPIPGM